LILSKLKTILQEAGTANPTHPMYAHLVTAEAEVLPSAAKADLNTDEAEEENQDLKRQLVFLHQQIAEKDRRIKILETMVDGRGKIASSPSTAAQKNSAFQVNVFS